MNPKYLSEYIVCKENIRSMFRKNWKKDIVTIPNILSILRILMIPVYVHTYRNAREAADYVLAGSVAAISCLSDCLDGYIARRYHMHSALGKFLDPLADKLSQLALCLTVRSRYTQVTMLIYLLVAKEICQLIGLCMMIAGGNHLPGSIPAGKLSTAVLFISLILLIIFPDLSSGFVKSIVYLDAFVLICALLGYYFIFTNKTTEMRKFQT